MINTANAISTFGSIYFNFSGEPPVNDLIPTPLIATKTPLISKLRQIQEKTPESYSLEEEGSIECPLKDLHFTIKNQKGSKQPLRWSPRKWINIDQSSSKTRSARKSSTPKAQSSTKYRDGGSSSKKWQIKVSKGFRSGFLFRRHFVLESMRLFQKAFDKTKNFKQNYNFLWHP